MEDMIYDVARIVFEEYPPIVQDYVGAITDGYKATWQLPPLIQRVGLTEEVILKVRSFRACCVIELFDFLSHSPTPASASAADHMLAAGKQRKPSDATRLVVSCICIVVCSVLLSIYVL